MRTASSRARLVGAVLLLGCALACKKKDSAIHADPSPDAAVPVVSVECRDERLFADGHIVDGIARAADAGTWQPSSGGRFEPRFVATAKGPSLRARAVARAACSVSLGIRTCGGDAFVRMPGFHGTLVLSLDVASPKLGLAMRLGGNANDMGVESCVLDVLRKASWDMDANGTTLLDVTWLPRASATRIREHFTQIDGDIHAEDVRLTVAKHHVTLRHCFDDARARDAALTNVFLMPKFVIDEAGKTSGVTLDPASAKDPVLHTCVVSAFAAITFPPPRSGKVKIVYPIELAFEPE